MDHASIGDWIRGYEELWRTAGTASLDSLFTEDVRYKTSPIAEAELGLEALAEVWEREREGPDEPFTLSFSVVAVDGDVAVVRLDVRYAAEPVRYLDLWVLRFAADGRCCEFEEWYWTVE